MKTNRLLLFLVLSCFSITSFGQYETFDLGKYSNPYYKRQQLDLNLNLNGSNSSSKYSTNDDFNSNHNSQFNGSFSGTFNKVKNSLKHQQDWRITLEDNPLISNQNYEYDYLSMSVKQQTKSNSLNNRFSFNLINSDRFYFKKLTFFEIGLNIFYSNIHDLDKREFVTLSSDSIIENKYNSSDLSGLVSFRFGKGRVEYVEDARLALYILEDLQKHGRLTRTLTNDEILEFSKTITQVKNKRFFDTRIRKIEEITKIDSFLNANNLVSKSDAAYFTTLTDNWNNASGPPRMAGLRYSVGLNPEYYRNIYNTHYANSTPPQWDSDYNKYGLSVDGQLDYDRPLNLYWQLTSGINLKYRLVKGNSKLTDHPNEDLNLNEFSSGLFVRIGFYPNSRTNWDVSLGLQYKNVTSKYKTDVSPINNDGKLNLINPNFSLNSYYYISQRLRLQASYQLSFYRSKENDEFHFLGNDYYPRGKECYNYFNIRLTYMLF